MACLIYSLPIDGFSGTTAGIGTAWEMDVVVRYDDAEWNEQVKEMLDPMRDAGSKLIQFTIFNRLYWIPVRKKLAGLLL